MKQFIMNHQLNLMMMLSGICGVIIVLLIFTRAITSKRKKVLIGMEMTAMLLVTFDRLAYIYAGDVSSIGYVMVRVSNFIVFFLTSEVVFVFNQYLIDLLTDEGKMQIIPRRLKIVNIMSCIGMFLVVVSQFTDLFYYFDEYNNYHRAPGFVICYIIPILGPIIQYSVIRSYSKLIRHYIYISLVLFLILPIIASIIQLVAYGLSLTNNTIVLVAVFLYIFAYLDINEAIDKARKVELEYLEDERKKIYRLFDQTVKAFVNAQDARNIVTQGHSSRVAEYSRMLATQAGKNEKECMDIYYAALVHDVGKVWIPDNIIRDEDNLTEEEMEKLKQKPVIGSQILSGISDYPNIGLGAHYYCERYDGKGYPEGLKGEDIPEVARIIAVANAYDEMTSEYNPEGSMPAPLVREVFVKELGMSYDPNYTNIMLKIMDMKANEEARIQRSEVDTVWENEIYCSDYRERVSSGIPITNNLTRVHLMFRPEIEKEGNFSFPSLILFDSYDGRVHSSAKAIKRFRYKEFGEIWFDGHIISTAARNMEAEVKDNPEYTELYEDDLDDGVNRYEIIMGKYEDHLKLIIKGEKIVEITVALPNRSSYAYIGITGEHCHLYNIVVEKKDKQVAKGDIKRIADQISYIDRMESDIPNLQIDGTRSAATDGILVKDGLKLLFHTMSLPSANLVWHCPYIILFDSADRKVFGQNYKEYAFVKLNGESNEVYDHSNNLCMIEKKEDFEDWEAWDSKNKKGYECMITFFKMGNKITMITENAGISIENVTTIKDGNKNIYVSLSGDQCALTDIRIL
ncbi:MAG: HD domain-containing protein [Lachnospiraceae bacterium]|nr:HD domain-containing protein [Lachnospiraceae bacterium]